MNKFTKVGLVAMLAATTLAGCGSDGGSDSATCPIRVGFVTDVGGIDDHSFNEGTWNGIKEFAKENGLDDSCIKYMQSKNDSDYEPNLSSFADEGYDLVVAAGFKFDKAIENVAPTYPDTHFLVIDTVSKEANVQSATFKAEQSSYLAGVAAAMQTKAQGGDTVGFIGGEEQDLIIAFQAGFEQGVKSIDPNMKIYVDYAGGFDKTEMGSTLAEKQYAAGAKVIYHAAGGTGNGVFAAAVARAEKGEEVWVIGVDSDQYDTGIYDKDNNKSVTLTSALKRVDVAAKTAAKQVLDGEFKAEPIVYTIAEDGVGLPEENPNISDEIQAKLDEVVQDMKDGKIEVTTKRQIENGQVG